MRPLAAVLGALLSVVALAPPAAAAAGHVAVQDSSFAPPTIRVEPGDTVVWEFQGSTAHTVTAVDRSFHSGEQKTGSFTHTFEQPGTVRYLCQIHGDAGMTGVVQVGEPQAPPPLPSTVVFVPGDGITLAEAADRATAGTTIVAEPGTHVLSAPLVLDEEGVTLRGGRRGDDGRVLPVGADDVVVTSAGATPTGVVITARGDGDAREKPVTTVADLTLSRFRVWGVEVDGAEGFVLANLRLNPPAGGWDTGVVARASRRGRLDDLVISGARHAALAIHDCDPCDITVERVRAEHSHTGVEIVNARHGIAVRASDLRGNTNGIVVATPPGRFPAIGVVLRDNTVGDHDGDAPRPPLLHLPQRQPGAGAGIWLAGTQQLLVTGNRVSGQRYGIVVTAGGSGSRDDRIIGNEVHGSQQADLAWDGVGAGTCFAGNRRRDGADTTSSPAAIETLYPCDRITVGVPNPVVDADLAVSALRSSLCHVDRRLCI